MEMDIGCDENVSYKGNFRLRQGYFPKGKISKYLRFYLLAPYRS